QAVAAMHAMAALLPVYGVAVTALRLGAGAQIGNPVGDRGEMLADVAGAGLAQAQLQREQRLIVEAGTQDVAALPAFLQLLPQVTAARPAHDCMRMRSRAVFSAWYSSML